MMSRVIVMGLIAALAMVIVSLFLYRHVTGVGVMRASRKNKRQKAEPKRRPAARAYVIGLDQEREGSRVEVPIFSVTTIYAAVGVGPNEFSQWQGEYGFGTSGRTKEGVLFVPNYPVLSKIAWMGIDTIDLSPAETSMLIEECTRARGKSIDAAANTELDALIALAREAIAVGGVVRFGLP